MMKLAVAVITGQESWPHLARDVHRVDTRTDLRRRNRARKLLGGFGACVLVVRTVLSFYALYGMTFVEEWTAASRSSGSLIESRLIRREKPEKSPTW